MNNDYIMIQIKSTGAKTQWILIRTMTGDPLAKSVHAAADIWTAGSRALSTPNDYKATGFATSAALTTHDGKIDTVDSNVDAILIDTDTMEADLKTHVDAIETNLQTRIEDNDILIDTAITNIAAVKSDTAAILIDTDTMETDLTTEINANETKIDTVITNIGNLNNLASSDIQTVIENNDLDHLIQVAAGVENPTIDSYFDQLLNKDGSQTYDPTTDSLEAQVDAGGVGDWTAGEKENIRSALGVDGTKTTASGGQLQVIDTNVDDIETDTGTTLPASLATIQADLDNPNQYKADVSLVATETNATSNRDIIVTDLDDIKGTGFIKDTDSLVDIRPETDKIQAIDDYVDTMETDIIIEINANETKIDAVKVDTAAILIDTDTMEADLKTEIDSNETKIDTVITNIGNLNNLSSSEVQTVLETNDLDHILKIAHPTGDPVANTIMDLIMNKDGSQTFDRTAESLEALRDRGDVAWLTGGGGGLTQIIKPVVSIPTAIDLANTKTIRLAVYLINQLDDLPTTGEITPGTIDIHRSADGGTSWSVIINGATMSELAGMAYYDEVFDSGSGYTEGDMIRITFKGISVTADTNTFEICGSDGMMFYAYISGAAGGSSDWTVNEKTEIKTVLGVTNTGTPDSTPGDGVLKEIQDNVDTNEGKIDIAQIDLDNPNQYKADVSTLALEASVSGVQAEVDKPDNFKADVTELANISGYIAPMAVEITQASGAVIIFNNYKADVTELGNISGYIAPLQVDLDNPNQFKADVTNLDQAISTTESNIRGGTQTLETISGLIDGIEGGVGGATAQEVWEYASPRTLSTPNDYWAPMTGINDLNTGITQMSGAIAIPEDFMAEVTGINTVLTNLATAQADLDNPAQYKADVSALGTPANFMANVTGINNLTTGITNLQTDLDNPDQYKAVVSALATEANATTNTTNIQTNIDTNETKIDTIQAKTDNLPDDMSGQVAIIQGLLHKNLYTAVFWDGDNMTGAQIKLYDSAFNAGVHSASGLLLTLGLTGTFVGGKPQTMLVVEE